MTRAKLLTLLYSRLAIFIGLAVLAVVTFALYFPGLYGEFIFDDYINIVTNTDAHLEQLSAAEFLKVIGSGMASILTRPLAMLSFGINYYLTGLDPFYFKLTNVLIHLLLSVGIYALSFELFKLAPGCRTQDLRNPKLLALAVAACWTVHPLNVSTVLYIVQRMTQLAALTTVFTLVFYCRFRQRSLCSATEGVLAVGVLGVLTLIGVLFKENAALVVLFIVCIEFYFYGFKASTEGHRVFLKLFIAVMLVLPGLAALGILVLSPDTIIGGYEDRTFTMGERLLTEARVLWLYIKWLLVPDLRELVFYYDNFSASTSLLAPANTLFAVTGIAGLLLFAFLGRKRFPLLCFGIAFFLAGHSMESTVIPLELVFEHRNYLPGFGLMFGLVYGLQQASAMLSTRTVAFLLGVYLLFLGHGTFLEARKWSGTYEHLSTIVRQSPDSHRINYALGYYLLGLAASTPDNAELLDLAARHFEISSGLNDKTIRGQVGVILANSQNGKSIDPGILNEMYARIRATPGISNFVPDIGMLVECRYSGFCAFDDGIIIDVFNAVASNRVSSQAAVQGIVAQTGLEIATTYGRKEDGRALLYLARNVRPDELTVIDLDLIQIELELGNYAEARAVLDGALKKRDQDGRFTQRLREAGQLLEQRAPAQ